MADHSLLLARHPLHFTLVFGHRPHHYQRARRQMLVPAGALGPGPMLVLGRNVWRLVDLDGRRSPTRIKGPLLQDQVTGVLRSRTRIRADPGPQALKCDRVARLSDGW